MEKKVLIVDDEERVVQSIAGVLEDEGFRVITARSGEEAVELFQQEEPDVTLLDIWMPGMDGIEVLKRLRGISPDWSRHHDLRPCHDLNRHGSREIWRLRFYRETSFP